ncbi:hypothetical protein ACLOJK_001943 [Asimina triloba]
MASAQPGSSAGPRYAPEDPTLPKPWKGLVDGKTQYLYYWNPETNVTQYEKPTAAQVSGPALPPPPKSPPPFLNSAVQIHQSGSSSHGRKHQHSDVDHRYYGGNKSGPKLAAIPGERSHQGNDVPAPFMTFDSTGYPSEILREGIIIGDRHPSISLLPGLEPLMVQSGTGFGQKLPHYPAPAFICGQPSQTVSRFIGIHVVGVPSMEDQCGEWFLMQLLVVRAAADGPSAFQLKTKLEASFFSSSLHQQVALLIGGCSFYHHWLYCSAVGSRFILGLYHMVFFCPRLVDRAVSRAPLCKVHHAGFSVPTPIQAQTWPIALQGRDIVAIAKTGSGKTLGYLIPGFIHLKHCHNNSKMGPTVLVLSPTRELATQIQDEAVKFGRSSRISCTCLYGGAPKGPQLRDLDRGTDVIVATPGRLNDILEMRRISLRQVSYLVLDEADRMLDMGFEPQIRKIVKEVPSRRQTLMYTATWPKEVRKIAADLLVNPIQVNIGGIDELVANKAITQIVEVLSPMEKQRRLEHILRSQEPGSKVIVFCSTKRMCDQLSRSITRQFGASAIHGDKSQGERDWVLNQFRSGKSPVLVATDVAARGLDIKDIRVVINYDFPTGIEDYVHRIGRTGRAGATGLAYTFFCEQDAKFARDLIKVLEGAGQRVPPEVREMALRGGGGKTRSRWGSGSGARDKGRSHGAGRDDSSRGGRGGRVTALTSGRPERGHVGRGHDDYEPRDRHHDGYEVDGRGRPDKGFPPNNNNRQIGDRSRGRSRSSSPVTGKGQGSGAVHSHARSRSRSYDRHTGAQHTRWRSPLLNRSDGPPAHNKAVDRSASPHGQQWESSRYHEEDGSECVEPVHSPSLRRERSHSPHNCRERSDSLYNGRKKSRSPYIDREGSRSPYDGRGRRSRSPYNLRESNGPLGLSPQNGDGFQGEDEEEGLIPEEEDAGNSTAAISDPRN